MFRVGRAGPSLCKSLDFPYPDFLSPSICPGPELSQLPTPSHSSPQWLQAIPVPVSTYTVLQLLSWKAHFNVIFFCLLGTHCLSLYAIQGLCGHHFIQPATNLKCLHIITGSKRWNVQVISMINASLPPGNSNSFFTSSEPVITQLGGCYLWNMSVSHGPYFEMIILKR